MWPFRRKKLSREPYRPGPKCSYCGSEHTTLVDCSAADGGPDYVRTWRGRRSLTCRCLDCGRDFYGDEPPAGVTPEMPGADGTAGDEEELRAAEDEVKRQAREEGGKWW